MNNRPATFQCEIMRTLGEFRKQTANLPDNTPLLIPTGDHCYRWAGYEITTAVAHICAGPAPFEPDCGDEPELYGYHTEDQIKQNRRTVVVIA